MEPILYLTKENNPLCEPTDEWKKDVQQAFGNIIERLNIDTKQDDEKYFESGKTLTQILHEWAEKWRDYADGE